MSSIRFLSKHGTFLSGILSRKTSPQYLAQSSHLCRTFAVASEADFEAAKDQLNALKRDPDNEAKLRIYGLFKQATIGQCSQPQPAAYEFIKAAKWNVWNDLGSMTKDDARQEYINTVNNLAKIEEGDSSNTVTEAGEDITTFQTIIYEVKGKAAWITLNRPKFKNSLIRETYFELPAAFKKASEDPNVSVAVLTGAGEYYCSGNDLNNLANISPNELKETCELGGQILKDYMVSFIDFPKPLIAAVNGPALGLAVTTLALCDVVYATDKATFMTPFSALGLGPEGCSSYLFPKIMGQARANEILLFGKTLSAQEAKDRGIVAEVFANDSFHEEVKQRVEQYSQLPPKSLCITKGLIRLWERDLLKKANIAECDNLVNLWQGKEFLTAAMKFLSRKK